MYRRNLQRGNNQISPQFYKDSSKIHTFSIDCREEASPFFVGDIYKILTHFDPNTWDCLLIEYCVVNYNIDIFIYECNIILKMKGKYLYDVKKFIIDNAFIFAPYSADENFRELIDPDAELVIFRSLMLDFC